MVKSSLLLEGEEIICQGPKELILTSDGWIGEFRKHNYEGLSQIFRLLHVRDIDSITRGERTNLQKFTHLFMYIFGMIMIACLFLSPFTVGLDVVLHGFDVESCDGIGTDDWTCEGENDDGVNAMGLAFAWFILYVIFERFDSTNYNWALEIKHKNGNMLIQEEEDWTGNIGLMMIGMFWILILYPQPGVGATSLVHYLLLIPLIIIAFLIIQRTRKEFISSSPSLEINVLDLQSFSQELVNMLELPNEPGTTQDSLPIGIRLESELAEIRKRLDDQDAILTTIIPVYADIFASPTPWLGTAAIRLSTEMLLKHRLSQLLPGASKKHKTLRNYTDELRKHDKDLDSETLGSLETIISLGNQAAHGRGSSKEDYISALQKFVEVVEWHLSKPTI